MRHLKAVGLAMLAAFALSAVAATGASAQSIGFVATDGEKTVGLETITAEDQVFQPEGTTSTLHCTNPDFTSHEHIEGQNPLTVNADYEDPEVAKDCFAETAFGDFNAIVHENGCDFDFYAETHDEQTGTFAGDAYVDCTTEGATEIEITVPIINCVFFIPTGTLTPAGDEEHPITYTNIEHESVEAVTVDVNGEIPYTHNGNCSGNAEGKASYVGHAVVGGYDTDKPEETVDVGVTTITG